MSRKVVRVVVDSCVGIGNLLDCRTIPGVIGILDEYATQYEGRNVSFDIDYYGSESMQLRLIEPREETAKLAN